MLKLKRWFSSSNGSKGQIRISSLSKLNESLEKLEEKERILQKKISVENERARDFTKSRNKKGAYECLKRKTYYESQFEQLEIFRLQVIDQMRMLKDAAEMNEL